jgi:hypothetical protein
MNKPSDITGVVFQYIYDQKYINNNKTAQKVWNWLQKDFNQFYDDGYTLIIEGYMPNYAYNYINQHSQRIRLQASENVKLLDSIPF